MTSSLRPLRIRVVDPTQVGGLLAYLRDGGCIAEQVGPLTIDVWPAPLLHAGAADDADRAVLEAGAVACTVCGGAVEEALCRLGSPRCHDCRAEAPAGLRLGAAANGDGRRRWRRALLELEAYLHAWPLDDGAAVAVLDDSTV